MRINERTLNDTCVRQQQRPLADEGILKNVAYTLNGILLGL